MFSLVLLACVNGIAFFSKNPVGKIVGVCLAFLLLLGTILPGVGLLALLLLVALPIWKVSGRGPLFFGSLSLASAAAVLGVAGYEAYLKQQEYAGLRIRYPFESMEARLPARTAEAIAVPISLSSDARGRLDRLEETISSGGIRSYKLRQLHEGTVALFVDSFGFGVGRMANVSMSRWITAPERKGPGPLQPGPRIGPAGSPGAWSTLADNEAEPLGRLHEGGVLDFVHGDGFGYIKDRRHVAGFDAHKFREVPADPVDRWEVQTLDLVGLVLEEEPRVYVSAHLPRMDALREIPTRVPDQFEAVGLLALRGGDDLYIARDGHATRMLGAVRSTKQCIACHGGERGDLLGAFTYTLRRGEKGITSNEKTAAR